MMSGLKTLAAVEKMMFKKHFVIPLTSNEVLTVTPGGPIRWIEELAPE